MRAEGLPFKSTGYFSKLITDYLEGNEALRPFYHRRPDIKGFKAQIQEKLTAYPAANRQRLTEVLQEQYADLDPSEATRANLKALADSGTLTVVTGHQLNLFTGPLYFHYKILTSIKLCGELKRAYPEQTFVPVYWMATEDHDFEEINHFNFQGKEFRWNRPSGGAVGRMDTDGLEALAAQFEQDLGPGRNGAELLKLFREAYLKHNTLAAATRYLADRLFGAQGLVVLDADDARLKSLFVPYMREDLLEGTAFREVTAGAESLKVADPDYAVQVNPREINLFYLDHGQRNRIVEENGVFHVLDMPAVFTREELLKELEAHPERFSPNVITRPLYQEVLLPNLAYVGGGGELAYWLELKSYFEASGIPFPVLVLRNSALLLSEKWAGKAERLGVALPELFLDRNRLINKKIREISNIDIDFSPQRKHLHEQFAELYTLAEQTDKSFLGAVKAQEVKQLRGLDLLEKRLLKAQKRKLKDHVSRLAELHNTLFPGGSLQERNRNFAEFYLEIGGPQWAEQLMECFEPLPEQFKLLIYGS